LRGLGWEFDADILPLIAQRSRGTPRLALRVAQAAHRVARSESEHSVSLRHFEKATLLEDLDAKGCGPTEQKYLRIVAEGPTRLNVIASRLGLPTRSISEIVEPYLIRSGLIVKDDQGRRQLSAEGREHTAI
jgi:Holliday junction DNA helicase RuvB